MGFIRYGEEDSIPDNKQSNNTQYKPSMNLDLSSSDLNQISGSLLSKTQEGLAAIEQNFWKKRQKKLSP